MNFKKAVAPLVCISILIFVNIPIAAPLDDDSIHRLPVGTRIRVRMKVLLSSRFASVDDTFLTEIAKPVVIRDTVVLPVGIVIEGCVTEVKRASTGGSAGALDIVLERLRLAENVTREMAGEPVKPFRSGSSHSMDALGIFGGAALGALVGGATRGATGAAIGAGIGGGAGAGISLARKGKDVKIGAGEEFEIELKRELVLPASDY